MKKEPMIFIQHMLGAINDIHVYIEGMDKTSFFKDKKTQDAVIRKLEIIGEAVKNLSLEFTKKYPQTQWSEIAKMRDRLIHGYFDVDLGLTYDILAIDLPKLKKQIKKILENIKG